MTPGWPNTRELRDTYDGVIRRLGNLGLPTTDAAVRALITDDEDAKDLYFLTSDDQRRHAGDDSAIAFAMGVLYGYAMAMECTSMDIVERIISGSI